MAMLAWDSHDVASYAVQYILSIEPQHATADGHSVLLFYGVHRSCCLEFHSWNRYRLYRNIFRIKTHETCFHVTITMLPSSRQLLRTSTSSAKMCIPHQQFRSNLVVAEESGSKVNITGLRNQESAEFKVIHRRLLVHAWHFLIGISSLNIASFSSARPSTVSQIAFTWSVEHGEQADAYRSGSRWLSPFPQRNLWAQLFPWCINTWWNSFLIASGGRH